MKLISNVKKLKNKLSPKSKSKVKHDDSDSSKSQFYDDINASIVWFLNVNKKIFLVKTFLLLSDNWEPLDILPLFDSLKDNLKKLSTSHETALKHKKNIAKTFNKLQTNGQLSNAAFLDDYKIQCLNIDSVKFFNILGEHESLSQNFIINSYKLFNMLINYEKKLQKKSPNSFEKWVTWYV